jgi:hypothetical protein
VVITVKEILVVPCGTLAEAGALRLNVPTKAARSTQIVIKDRTFNEINSPAGSSEDKATRKNPQTHVIFKQPRVEG